MVLLGRSVPEPSSPSYPPSLHGRYPLQRYYGGSVVRHRLCTAAAILTYTMTPSTVLTPTTPQGRPSSLDTGAAVGRLSHGLRLRQHPPELSPADASSTPARPLRRPNRVYLRLGPVFCLGILPTPHRGSPRHDAVSLGYPPLTCHRRTQTCTGWFHGFISVRRTGVPPGGNSKSEDWRSPGRRYCAA